MSNYLFNLTRDKNYWTTLAFLLNNEENIEKRIMLFELICKSDFNAAIIIADSFFIDADCNRLMNIVYNKILKYTDINRIRNISRSKQFSLYISFLTFDLYDMAIFVIKEISNNSSNEKMFPFYLFDKYFSQRWITKHIILLMKLNMWKEVNRNLNFLPIKERDFYIKEGKEDISREAKKLINDKIFDTSKILYFSKFLMSLLKV